MKKQLLLVTCLFMATANFAVSERKISRELALSESIGNTTFFGAGVGIVMVIAITDFLDKIGNTSAESKICAPIDVYGNNWVLGASSKDNSISCSERSVESCLSSYVRWNKRPVSVSLNDTSITCAEGEEETCLERFMPEHINRHPFWERDTRCQATMKDCRKAEYRAQRALYCKQITKHCKR